MISVSDFRNGVTFDMDGKVMQIVEFQHVKPGKGAAFVRTKMKNIMTGEVMRILDGPFGIADVTIENLLCGTNNGVIEENIRRIQAITPAEVQRLAVKYLRREDLITAVVGAVDPKHEI